MQMDLSALLECDPKGELTARNFVTTDYIQAKPTHYTDMNESFDTLGYDPEGQMLFVGGN
jgi:hypothetical protein